MVKKQTRSLAGKKFFSMVVLSVAALGLMVTTLAVQQRTNTESEAACLRAPSFDYVSKRWNGDTLIYKLKLTNNCPGYNQFKLRVVEEPTQPQHYFSWKWRFNVPGCNLSTNAGCYIPNVSGSKYVEFAVFKPSTPRSGIQYSRFVVQASLRSNDNLRDRAYFNYNLK